MRCKREMDAAREQDRFMHFDYIDDSDVPEKSKKATQQINKVKILKDRETQKKPTAPKFPSTKTSTEQDESSATSHPKPGPAPVRRIQRPQRTKIDPLVQLRKISNTTQKLTDVFTPIAAENLLGEGASGKVYKVARVEDGKPVALKVHNFA